MNTNNEFNLLQQGEIISLNHHQIARHLNLPSTGFPDIQIKSEQFQEVIFKKLNLTDASGQTLFDKGIACEVMKFGAEGWQKGKVRAKLILEFCPDEPSSEEQSFSSELEL